MQKQIKNLILFSILTLNLNVAFCYTLTSAELKNEILNKITPEIKQQLKQYSSDFKINIQGISQNSIVTNDNIKPKIEIISQKNEFSPNSYRRVLIKDIQNNTIKVFPINVQTLVYQDVLVATNAISYNQEINFSNSKLERREISKYLGKTYNSQISGVITKRNYQKGNIIVSNYTNAQFSILKNSSVDIVFQSKNMNIKLRGKALKDGAIGDAILVKSDKYNKTYTGIVKSQNEVMVRI